jgi:cytochrome b561
VEYDRYNRIIHWGVAATVSLQLLSEQLMRPLRPEQPAPDATESFFFIIHQYIGFLVLFFVGLRLISLLDEGEKERARLFPWSTPRGRTLLLHELRHELPQWLKGRLKSPDEENVTAATVHGLGLCLALGLGLSGIILFIGTKPDGSMDSTVRFIMGFHEILGTLMWVFILGHAGMGVVHQIVGHRAFQRIFSLKA